MPYYMSHILRLSWKCFITATVPVVHFLATTYPVLSLWQKLHINTASDHKKQYVQNNLYGKTGRAQLQRAASCKSISYGHPRRLFPVACAHRPGPSLVIRTHRIKPACITVVAHALTNVVQYTSSTDNGIYVVNVAFKPFVHRVELGLHSSKGIFNHAPGTGKTVVECFWRRPWKTWAMERLHELAVQWKCLVCKQHRAI